MEAWLYTRDFLRVAKLWLKRPAPEKVRLRIDLAPDGASYDLTFTRQSTAEKAGYVTYVELYPDYQAVREVIDTLGGELREVRRKR